MTVDLSTRYLGRELKSPIIASASPLTREPEMVARLEEAGIGAIVMPSLFEEEIENEEIELAASLDAGTEGFAEALDYFPEVETFIGEGERYLRTLERIKRAATRARHRQPERQLRGRLGPLCAAHGRCRRRCPGAEPLPHHRGPDTHGRRHRG